ncbi:DUF6247 family protein [Spongiactinospora sp. 9N601]|uniref:DUF6247 family protein n=1 Tax=Spongiactinospora sp. 9N601 TaxID=3375149 RepID=UPI003789B0CB
MRRHPNDLRFTQPSSSLDVTVPLPGRSQDREHGQVRRRPRDQRSPARTPERAPEDILAALLPDDAGGFLREYRSVTAEAMEAHGARNRSTPREGGAGGYTGTRPPANDAAA